MLSFTSGRLFHRAAEPGRRRCSRVPDGSGPPGLRRSQTFLLGKAEYRKCTEAGGIHRSVAAYEVPVCRSRYHALSSRTCRSRISTTTAPRRRGVVSAKAWVVVALPGFRSPLISPVPAGQGPGACWPGRSHLIGPPVRDSRFLAWGPRPAIKQGVTLDDAAMVGAAPHRRSVDEGLSVMATAIIAFAVPTSARSSAQPTAALAGATRRVARRC